MSPKGHAVSVAATSVTAVLLTFTVAGCGGSGGHAASALTTSEAVTKAKAQLGTCIDKVGVTHLVNSAGRAEFGTCMKSVVSAAKQEQFKNCIVSAAGHDRLWTSAGRSTFVNESLPKCVDAAS